MRSERKCSIFDLLWPDPSILEGESEKFVFLENKNVFDEKKIHSVSCLTRVYLCAEIEAIWIFDPCHKNLIFVRFLHGCPLNKDHLLYTSLANSSHGGSWIRPCKILLRYNTYVRTNDYINQIYLNAHIIPWSCLSKHSPYGFKLFTESLFSMRCLRYNPHKRI